MTLLGWCLLSVAVLRLNGATAFSVTYLPQDPAFGHQTGSACGSGAWCAIVSDTHNAWMTYGPYFTGYPASTTTVVTFSLAVDNNSNDELPIAMISVAGNDGTTIFGQRTLIRSDWLNSPTVSCFSTDTCFLRNFSLMFTTPADTSVPLEFRVFYIQYSALVHFATFFNQFADATATGALWANTAHFEHVAYLNFPTPGQANSSGGMNVGFDFVSMGSLLYMFHREFFFAPTPAYCPPVYSRLLVRVSSDGGRSFSAPTVLASPIPNSPSECGLVDGAAYYDAQSNSWYYLSQCIARDSVWNMCLFYLVGSADPMVGTWVAAGANPVVRSGQLWQTICCTTRPCSCDPGTMGSEGTPDIVGRDSEGFFYVTFHGWDPTHVKSARGVAKTPDFVNWYTRGPRLPGDAIFSSADCNGWNVQWAAGGCVGGGEGSIVRSGGYMYQIIEAPDVSLGCVGQQNWVLGLLRAPDLDFLPTGGWQQFYVMPTVVPAVKTGCYIQYQRLFYHNGLLHFAYWAGVGGGSYHITALTGAGAGTFPIVAVERSLQ